MTNIKKDIEEFIGLIDGHVHTIDPLLLDMHAFVEKFRDYLDAGEGDRSELKEELVSITSAIKSSPVAQMIAILERN
jgi:hypothetical protein